MSTMDINNLEAKLEGENDENKTPDKQQIEDEEKEVMLKSDETEGNPEVKSDNDGPVKTALSGDITEQGREVKPKFIPIGAIKMPGFFMKNSDKDKCKQDEDDIEKIADNEKTEDEAQFVKYSRFEQFLHACPFTQFLNKPDHDSGTKSEMFSIRYPKIFRKSSNKPEATLASMETLEDKLDTPNDGMENVKLEMDTEEGKVATKLPLKERIRQKKFIVDDIVVCGLALLVLLAVVVGVIVGARAGPPAERPLRLGRYITTLTSCGPVEGTLDEGVYNFYNIPYAVPPVGEKRFTYAQPLNLSTCWNGTYNAQQPGPLCLQFLENGTIAGEEDCLTLDVVTPHVRYDSPLPVVVLIGANSLAGGVSPAQPSALYARTKEVVFVRPNFRLGPFGFLALDIISNSKYPPTSGNYALSDLLAALQWVKYNIKHFGGDASSVTLLGHRAGATLTAALTTVPKAQQLYSRVWLSSASVIFPGEPLDQAQKNNEPFKQRIKCDDMECLQRASTTEILSATPDIWLGDNVGTLPIAGEFQHSWLVLDGHYLRVHAYESWNAQKEAKNAGKEKLFKPMVFGTTEHSGHSELLHKKHLNWTSEIVEKMVNESAIGEKNLTSKILNHFNRSYDGLVGLISAVRTLCPLVSLARLRLAAPMYVVMGSGAGAGASGSGKAGINADVEAILGTFDSEEPEQRRFMAAMQQLFYYFVWHGLLPGADSGLIAVGQDQLPLHGLPACDSLIQEDLVPRYAHID
ncbi:neurotactin isoform X1 [Ostrinia furnacalis]|uniref:neurotactin isoform X1 n=1 Tax=Ostrinia furnacalis TaxID=93504 RepID=UPI001039955C|nr:neurotactin isoform X1 [Ostrinia furnacalis]